MSEEEAIAAIEAEIEKRVADDQFSGAALIAKAGKPVFQRAYGYANIEKKIPNKLDTKFIYGSMAKMFTGVAVIQLVQAGKIQVEDPISKYLSDYPNRETAAVTVHQLLTHTGGTGDVFGDEFTTHRAELKELKDYVTLYGARAAIPAGQQAGIQQLRHDIGRPDYRSGERSKLLRLRSGPYLRARGNEVNECLGSTQWRARSCNSLFADTGG
jgi:CubicO group peptidase (beta-lactamase class C family)